MAGEPGRRPVTLVANLTTYHHAAVALDRAGLLERYLTLGSSTRPLPGAALPGAGPVVRRFNATRVAPVLATLPVRRLWAAQLAAEAARRTGERGHPGRTLAVRAELWDRQAARLVDDPAVLHITHGIARHTAGRVRRQGGLVVLEVRAAHPDARRRAVAPAMATAGVPWRLPNEAILDRLAAELALADVVLCPSPYVAATYAEAGVPAHRLAVVELGCDTRRFHPAAERPDRFTVLFVGRGRWEKGFADLAVAARSLPAGARLLVTGQPGPRAAEWLTGVAAEVEFLGAVPAGAMADVYRRASVLALPSHSDGFGLVVPEALASGVPVVVSDHTGAAVAVQEGTTGFVVPAGDAEALADRLVALAGDPGRVSAMGEAARASSAAWSWDAYGERLVRCYRERILPLRRR